MTPNYTNKRAIRAICPHLLEFAVLDSRVLAWNVLAVIMMDYVYVDDLYDPVYRTPPPIHKELKPGDVPEQEFEIREVLDCWYYTGFLPYLDARLGRVNFWEHANNFKRLTKTLTLLIRCRSYQCAVKRITSQWRTDSLERRYINYLLTRVN